MDVSVDRVPDTLSNGCYEIAVATQDGSVATVCVKAVPRAHSASFLQAVEGLPKDIHVPAHTATLPGAYCGVKGEFSDENGDIWLHIKVGKYDYAVETRIQTHGCDYPHWRTMWQRRP